MRPLAIAALLALLVAAPMASAQFRSVPAIGVAEPDIKIGSFVEIRPNVPGDKGEIPIFNPWIVAGYDNVLNLTIRNGQAEAINATFTLNVTGATFSPAQLVLNVPPHGYVGATFVVHPADVGMVSIEAESIDAFQPSGEPLKAGLELPALVLPSMRFLDPPEAEPSAEDDEFVEVSTFGRHPSMTGGAHVRIRPGESVTPRIELENPFETGIAGFRLRMQVPGQPTMSVDVPAIDAGDTYVAEFDEFRPVEASFGQSFGGPVGSFELRPLAELTIGGAAASAGAVRFGIESGAITDLRPTFATIDVQDGLAIDLFMPRDPSLGAPTRVKYNLTNLQTTPAQGMLTLTLMPPGGLFYEVQGPETTQVPIALGPGEVVSGAISFTPRVTGAWSASTLYRASEGFGYGGGGGFEVLGPVVISFDRTDQVFARIGEPIEVGISILTTDTLQDAQLRVSAGTSYYRDPTGLAGSDYRPGFADTLVESRTLATSLGTLRPGGALNTSVEIVGRTSGSFNIIPYLIAEGFAYTSTLQRDPSTQQPIDTFLGGSSMLSIAVQPRAVPSGLALAPLTLGLAFFVGAWTLRTRFVK